MNTDIDLTVRDFNFHALLIALHKTGAMNIESFIEEFSELLLTSKLKESAKHADTIFVLQRQYASWQHLALELGPPAPKPTPPPAG